jgi:hypothetical protein
VLLVRESHAVPPLTSALFRSPPHQPQVVFSHGGEEHVVQRLDSAEHADLVLDMMARKFMRLCWQPMLPYAVPFAVEFVHLG